MQNSQMQEHVDFIPEWAAQYVDTTKITQYIHKLEELDQAMKKDSNNKQSSMYQDIYNQIETKFFQQIYSDMQKIEKFYQKELDTAAKRTEDIKQVIRSSKIDDQKNVVILEENIIEIYKGIDLLIDYCAQNSMQLRKLSKEYDVNNHYCLEAKANKKIRQELKQYKFHEPDSLEQLKDTLESALALVLGINNKDAKQKLAGNYTQHDINIKQKGRKKVQMGIMFGISLVMFLAYVQMLYIEPRLIDRDISISTTCRILIRIQILLAWMIINLGMIIWGCEQCHINYLFLWDCPATETALNSSPVLFTGYIYMAIITFVGIISISSAEPDFSIPLPFGQLIRYFSHLLSPEMWILITTGFHFVIVYYTVIDIFRGQNDTMKHFYTVVYKTITPWAFNVPFPCFCLGCFTTSLGRFIKDIARIITKNQINEYALCCIAGYGSIIRLIQCCKRWKETGKKFYPHMLNGTINVFGFLGCFLHAKSITSNKLSFQFWFFFLIRVIETSGKLYWDYAEDGGFFTGGTACKPFKNQPEKWQYGKVCPRPSFLPLSWIWFHVIHNTPGRMVWVIDSLFSNTKFVKSYEWILASTMFEIFRRCFWTILRMDNQQLTNCENYCATRYVPILVDAEANQNIATQVQRRNTILTTQSNFNQPIKKKSNISIKNNSSFINNPMDLLAQIKIFQTVNEAVREIDQESQLKKIIEVSDSDVLKGDLSVSSY